MNARAWQQLTAPILRRIRLMLTRGLVKLVDPSTLLQSLQVEALAGEVLDGIEHFEPYGFTGHPYAGAEVVLASIGGRRAQSIVICVADRRYRLTGLAEGEVALYDDQGQKVHLKRAGIDIKTPLKVTLEAGATVELKGATGAAVKGLVQGDCLCAFTGQPHPMVSATVKGSA